MATELRKPVYRPVAARAISYDHVLQQMNNVRWDIREIMSQHNSYVDTLLKVIPLVVIAYRSCTGYLFSKSPLFIVRHCACFL